MPAGSPTKSTSAVPFDTYLSYRLTQRSKTERWKPWVFDDKYILILVGVTHANILISDNSFE